MATHTTVEDKKFYTTGQAVDHFKNIHDGLLAVGLTKTADTGQIDLTTAPTVTVNNANFDYGYNIFQFTDAFQSTYPIYVKVRYMNHQTANNTQCVTVRLEVGEGTDGSGGLTGKTDTRFSMANINSTTNSGTLSTNNICFADGTLVIHTSVIATSGTINAFGHKLLAVGRRKDMSGGFTEGAYKIQSFYGSSTVNITTAIEESHISDYRTTLGVLTHTTPGSNQSILRPYHWTSENTSFAYDNSNGVFPIYTLTPKPEIMSGVIAVADSVGYNNTFVSDLGTGTKTFITTNGGPANTNTLRLAHIWE